MDTVNLGHSMVPPYALLICGKKWKTMAVGFRKGRAARGTGGAMAKWLLEDVNLETIDGIARSVLLSMCVCVFDVLLLVFQCLCCCMFLFDKALVHRRFLHMMKDLPAVLEIHFVISTIVWMLDGLLRSLVAPELWQPWKPLKLIAVSWLLSVFKRRRGSTA